MEDVRTEQVHGITRELVLHPGDDPLVEHHVAVVVQRESSRVSCERPGMGHCQERGEEHGLRPVRTQEPLHRAARLRISVSSMSIATVLWPPSGMITSA